MKSSSTFASALHTLATPAEYSERNPRQFPSEESVRWFIRRFKPQLVEAGALSRIRGRDWVVPEPFDEVVLTVGASQLTKEPTP